MPLVFIPIVIFPFVFSKLLVFQILVGLTFPAYLLLAWMEPRYRPGRHILYGAIIAYFIAIALSVIFAVDPTRAWWGNQERMNGLFTLLHFFAWLTMTISILVRWEQWRSLLNYQIVLSVIMAIVALLQKPFPNLLLFPAQSRVGGLLDNPIYMGAYQIFNLYFLALLFIKHPSKHARIWYGIAALIDVSAFVAAQSRGALLGLAAGVVAFALYYAIFTKNKKVRFRVLGAAAALFIAYGLLFSLRNTTWVSQSSFSRFTNFSGSISTRLIAWNIAWKGFLERPITGWGFDNFHLLFNIRYNPQSLRFGPYETWFDRSHNTILDVLSMTGILGFITFAAIYLTLFYSAWRAFRKGWIDLPVSAVLFALPIAYFVQNLFVFDHPAAFSMSFLLYALVIASTRGEFIGQKAQKAEDKHEGKRAFSWTAFGILQALALILVWKTSVLPFEASRLAIHANQLFAARQFDAAYDGYQQASRTWTPYLDEQSFLLSRDLITLAAQGNLTKIPRWKEFYQLAKDLSEEEIRRHGKNTHPHFIYARLLHEVAAYLPMDLGDIERQYRAAIETSPKRQQLYYGLARLYLQTKRPQLAVDIYRQVRDFDPELGEGHWMYGLSLYYDLSSIQDGAKELVASQAVAYRYALQDAREIIPLVDAYVTLKDQAGLKKYVLDRLQNFPKGTAVVYAELAQKLQDAKWNDARDELLAFAQTVDPSTKDTFEKGLQGVSTLTAPPAPTAPSANAQVATSAGRGPRR